MINLKWSLAPYTDIYKEIRKACLTLDRGSLLYLNVTFGACVYVPLHHHLTLKVSETMASVIC